MLYEKLKEHDDALAALSARLDTLGQALVTLTQALDKTLTALQGKSAALSEKATQVAAAPAVLLAQVTDYVDAYWYTHRKPTPLRVLARSFSTSVRPYGGFRALAPALTASDGPLALFVSQGGAQLLFPRKEFVKLSSDEISAFAQSGLTDAQVRKQETEQRKNELSDAENAEAFAALNAKLTPEIDGDLVL